MWYRSSQAAPSRAGQLWSCSSSPGLIRSRQTLFQTNQQNEMNCLRWIGWSRGRRRPCDGTGSPVDLQNDRVCQLTTHAPHTSGRFNISAGEPRLARGQGDVAGRRRLTAETEDGFLQRGPPPIVGDVCWDGGWSLWTAPSSHLLSPLF